MAGLDDLKSDDDGEMSGPLAVPINGEVVVNTDDPEEAKEVAQFVVGMLRGGEADGTVVGLQATDDVYEYQM